MSDLERFEPRDEPTLALPWWELLPRVAQIVDVVVRTPFVGPGLRGNTASATAAVMYGHELGLGPMTSLNKLHVIDGQVQPSAELARALAMRVGEVWVEDESDERVTVAARRHGSEVVHRSTWTLADARRARLLDKANWRTYPRAMLYARASAEVVRRAFPDVLGGITRVAEEFDDEPELTPVVEPSRSLKRSRAKAPHRMSMDEAAQFEPQRALEASESASSVESASSQPESESVAESEAETLVDETPPPRVRTLGHPSTGKRPPTTAQLNQLRLLVRRLELADDSQRAGKLELVSSIVQRTVDSTSDLDADEASAVIAAFQSLLDGTARIGMSEDGMLRVEVKR